MQHLYFLRHCRTILNAQGRISGVQDSKLCDEAAINNIELFEAKSLIIISSDLGRCKKTVNLLVPLLETPPLIYYSELLHERNMGVFEGEKRSELIQKYPYYFEKMRFRFKMTPPDGESYQQFQKRIQCFIKKEFTTISNKNKDNILICAHNQVLKQLYCELVEVSADEMWGKLDFESGKIKQVY